MGADARSGAGEKQIGGTKDEGRKTKDAVGAQASLSSFVLCLSSSAATISAWTSRHHGCILAAMDDPTWLFLSALFSLIGMAVFAYGRRQRTATHTLIGVALMGYPYFVHGTWQLVGVGVALLVGMVLGNRFESD